MENNQVDAVLNTKQTAELLGVTHWTIREWSARKKNALPSIKLSHRVKRYSRNAVLAWVYEQGARSAS